MAEPRQKECDKQHTCVGCTSKLWLTVVGRSGVGYHENYGYYNVHCASRAAPLKYLWFKNERTFS